MLRYCMCIGDYHGHFIKAFTKWYDTLPSPSEADAMGLCDAILCMAESNGKLDCKVMVDRSNNQSEFGNIMSRCRSLLCHVPNISFVQRQANCVAHAP